MTTVNTASTVVVDEYENAGRDSELYLCFLLAGETYGLPIMDVQEITGLKTTTRVPNTLSYVKGVFNLRGKVIPIIDARLRLELTPEAYTDRTSIIIVQANDEEQAMTIGMIVDGVSDVIKIYDEDIAPVQGLSAAVGTDIVSGMGRVEDEVIQIIQTVKLLENGNWSMDLGVV